MCSNIEMAHKKPHNIPTDQEDVGKKGAHQEQNWTVKPVPLTPSCTAVPRGPSMGDLFSLGRGGRSYYGLFRIYLH